MAITYKTVINNAIKGFNDIQAKLAEYTDLGVSAVSVSNGTVSGALTPANLITNIGKMATIKNSDGTFISGKVNIVTPKFDGGGASIKSSSTSASASGLTMSDTDTDPGSGIYITTSGSATPKRAAVLYNGAVSGYVSVADNTSALAAADGSATTLSSNKYYVTGVTVPKDKTFSVTMTADTAADTTSNLTITNAAYRTVSINGGGDKGVKINGANGKTAIVDGTTVTNSSGDLITDTPAFDGGGLTVPNSSVSLTKGDTDGTGNITSIITDNGTNEPTSGYYVAIKGTASAITASRANVLYNGSVSGWVSVADNAVALNSTTKANSATNATEYFTIPEGVLANASKEDAEDSSGEFKDHITLGEDEVSPIPAGGYLIINEGYYPKSKISLGTLIPDDADFTNAGNAQIRSGYEAYDSDGNKLVGTIGNWSPSSTYYTTTNTGYGVVTAGKYVSSTRYIKKGSVTSSVSGTNPTVTPSVSISGTIANYGITTTKPSSGTDGTNYLTLTPGGSSDSQTFTAAMSLTAGWVAAKGTEGTKSVSATVSTDGTKYYIPVDTPAFDGGGASIASSSTSASASGLTMSDTDTDPGSGIYITTSGSATPKRAAVLYNGAVKGLVNVADNTTALAAANGSATTLSSNTYYITGVTVPKDKTFSVEMTADTAADTTSNLTITNAAYRTVSINGGGDKGVKIDGANGKTATVDGTTVTNASGDLTTTSRSASTGYVTLTAGDGSASVSGSNVTLSDTNNGISVTATGSGTVSGTGYGKVSTGTGWITSGTTQSNTSSSASATSNEATATKYISAITVPKSKTLSSVTLTSGTSSSRTYLTTATVNSYTTISTLNLSGVITSLVHNSDGYVSTQNLGTAGSIKTLISSSGGYIGTVSGTLAINNVGTSSTASTLTVGTNTYGTINVWNAGEDKGVQVKNHTVKVDGVTVTNSSGDLITDTPVFDGGGLTVPNPSVSLAVGETDGTGNITSAITDNGTTEPTSGYYVAIKGTASAITASRANVLYNGAVSGWVGVSDNAVALSSATKSNSAVSATEYFKIPSGAATLSGNNPGKPSISKVDITSSIDSDGYNGDEAALGDIYDSLGTVTTTLPSTGHYIAVQSSSTSTTISGSASTAGYIASGTSLGSKTVTTPASDVHYIPITDSTKTHSGGGLTKGTASGGGLSGGGLSGGGLSITTNYSGTPTVDITLDGQTTSGVTITDTKPTSGYYLTIGASSSALSGKTKATRAAVTRAAVSRAKFSQTVNRAAVTCTETAGYVKSGSHTCLAAGSSTVELAAGSLAADSTTIGATSVEPTVTVNKGTKTEYVVIPSGSHNVTVTNSVTAPKVTVSGSATGFTASSSATSYYVTVSGSGTNGSVTSNASCTATAGYIAAGTDTASDTDSISTTITGSGNKVYIPAAASTMYASSSANTTTNCIKGTTYLRTAGYAPTGAKTVYVTSPSVVGTVSLTVGSGARLNTANNGTIDIVSNEGTLIVDEWQMRVEYTEDNDNSQTTSVIFTLGD